MTGWRFGKLGPGELMLFTWAIASFIVSVRSRQSGSSANNVASATTHLLYWLSFLSIIALATLLQTGRSASQDISNIITWVFLGFISVSIAYFLRARSPRDIEAIVSRIASATAVWYGCLYVYSKTLSSTFLGAPLWYGDIRFSGGGTNPHQVALLLVAVTQIFLYRVLSPGMSPISAFQRATAVGGFVVSLALTFETQSETAYYASLLASLLSVLIAISSKLQAHTSIVFWSVVIVSVAAFESSLRHALTDFVESDPNGLGRIELWRTVTSALDQNQAIGLGPGAHANEGVNDFHSTYFDILAMSGLLGFGLFMGYSVLLLWKSSRVPLLLPILASLYLYGISGFAARRLPFWTILMLSVLLAERSASIQQPAGSVNPHAPALHRPYRDRADRTRALRSER